MGRQIHWQTGFTYLWILIAVALIGVGLMAIGDLWAATQRTREREELIWVAEQYVQALDSYYEGSPGIVVRTFPLESQELLEDHLSPRTCTTHRCRWTRTATPGRWR